MRVVAGLVLCFLLAGCAEQIDFADGTHTQLGHWDGRWLVINYWAEWCAPCRHEIPELNELHHDRVAHGIVVLGVNWDQLAGARLAESAQTLGIEFPVLSVDPQTRYGYERPEMLPTTVLIDPQRQVRHVLVGPQTAASLRAAILSSGESG